MADKNGKNEETYTREEVQKLVADGASSAAKAAVESLLPTMAALVANAKTAPAGAVVMQAGQLPRQPVIRCNECGQDQRACALKDAKTGQYTKDADGRYIKIHVKLVVFPKRYPEFAKWFMGVTINGVRYLSDNASHEVVVPSDAVSGILSHIQVWEDNERTTKLGKKVSHNSGDVANPNQNVPYFR